MQERIAGIPESAASLDRPTMPAPDDTASNGTISLSLISHTNVGKTTLARTLLGRDIGEIRDSAHVTDTADEHLLVETPPGDRLVLWDTPGFGDSARLMKRLANSDDPIGRFLGDVWDRFRDRAFWSSQQAVRNVRDQADIVLYLVNASESPDEAGYVAAEMRVLEWIGKPVVVLLNQLGPPRGAQADAAEVQTWREHLSGFQQVRAVLPLDAFARCWVQEGALLHALGPLLPETQRPVMERLVEEWLRRRREIFEASIDVLATRIARAASDRETLGEGGMLDLMRDTGSAVLPRALRLGRRAATTGQPAPSSARQVAMQRLAERLDAEIRESTDRLIALHGLEGRAGAEVLRRLAEHYVVKVQVSERKAAVLGGAVTGALTGLNADIATGGLTFGAGLLAGGVVGALGAFGLARGYNLVRGAKTSSIAWSDGMLDELVTTALLGYLAVAHYGRGRGDWAPSEHPPHWREVVESVLEPRRKAFAKIWTLRGGPETFDSIERALRPELGKAALETLDRLYPGAREPARAPG